MDCGDADSDAQPSRLRACCRPGRVEQRVKIANNVASLAVKKLSGCRKTDIAPSSHQQWTTDLLLQALDLLAQRGLRDVQRLGRLPVRAKPGNRGDVFQLFDPHNESLPAPGNL